MADISQLLARNLHDVFGDGDPAELGEGVDPGFAAEASVTRGADAAERHLRFVLNRRAVDVANARSDAPRDPEAARDVAGEDRCGQAVLAVVGDADRFLF